MHFKMIVLEIAMKSKSEEKIQLVYTYSLPPPPPPKNHNQEGMVLWKSSTLTKFAFSHRIGF